MGKNIAIFFNLDACELKPDAVSGEHQREAAVIAKSLLPRAT
jgi:hypothetical protein